MYTKMSATFTEYYHIAGNFRRRKLSQIGKRDHFADKTSRNAKSLPWVGMAHPNFTEKTFVGGPKTAKFVKVFSDLQ